MSLVICARRRNHPTRCGATASHSGGEVQGNFALLSTNLRECSLELDADILGIRFREIVSQCLLSMNAPEVERQEI